MVRVLIRGAGDIASGIGKSLFNSGFLVLMTDIKNPTAIRRSVAFSSCIYNSEFKIENVSSRVVKKPIDVNFFKNEFIGVIEDESCEILNEYKPDIVVDSILAKKNLGTNIKMAKIVIGVGPGFKAGIDCDLAIETQRGHNLGRHIWLGSPTENTGIPGMIHGRGKERVIYSPGDGFVESSFNIGDEVKEGEVLLKVDGKEYYAPFNGMLRGLIHKKVKVFKGMKIGDIDPRIEKGNCYSISDKANSIGRSVLEGILILGRQGGIFEVKKNG